MFVSGMLLAVAVTTSYPAGGGCSAATFAQSSGSPVAVGWFPSSIAVGDFNLDGKPDMAVANEVTDNVTILIGNGNGGFPTGSAVGGGDDPRSIAVGDFNLDGKADLAIANPFSQTLTVRLGDGVGGFPDASHSFGTAGFPNAVAAGDLNLDGKLDLAVPSSPSSVSIYLGDGTGSFAGSGSFGTGNNPKSVAIADLNLDGKPDLAVANAFSNSVTILLGNGTGGFPGSSTVGCGANPVSVAIGDLNLDGRPDLVVANQDSHSVTVRLGDGLGGFPDLDSSTWAAGSFPAGVAIGDLDLDGKLDLAVANGASDDVKIRLGDGTGAFPDIRSSTVGGGLTPRAVAISDLNLDGKPDLAIPNLLVLGGSNQAVTVQLNTTGPAITIIGANPMTVECHATFNDPGATAVGICGNPIDVTVSGSVDPNTPQSYTITYTALDGTLGATATRTVNVVDATGPTITPTAGEIVLRRPNHRLFGFDVSDFVSQVSDGCDSAVGISDVVITSVASDEPEDARGNGDGNTLVDIVIAPDCKSVQLRNERAELRNGRVYTVTLAVKDSAGNVGTVTCQVSVPVGARGSASDDGASAGYTVTGCSP